MWAADVGVRFVTECRKSSTLLSVVGKQPHLVSSLPTTNPPPPPDHLEEPERVIWRAVVAEFKGPRLSYEMLADALKAHQCTRKCNEVIAAEGLTVKGRDGQLKAHPLLAIERSRDGEVSMAAKNAGN